MNNNYFRGSNGLCPNCRKTLVVNLAHPFERCPFCNYRFQPKHSADLFESAVHQAAQQRRIQNVKQEVIAASPEEESDINTSNKKMIILIILLCVGALLLFAIWGGITKHNSNKRADQRTALIDSHEGEILMAESPSSFIGKNYRDVELRMKNYGFNNVKLIEYPNTENDPIDRVSAISINGYDDFKNGDWFKPDSVVRIYYYTEAVITTTTISETTSIITTSETVVTTTMNEEASTEQQIQGVTPEFKQVMDNYEAFFDEYIAFMSKLGNDNDSDDLSVLGDYFSMLEKEAKMMEEMEAIDESELSEADDAYYLEVTMRIYQKLMNASFSMY